MSTGVWQGEYVEIVDWTARRALCVVCGGEFTDAEWNDRHWPRDGGEAHACCCPDCQAEEEAERDGVTVAGLNDDEEEE